jgi:sialic acid synthase SpsE
LTVISEIGYAHEGNMYKAYHLIDEAKKAGADLAKFQLYDAVKVLGHPVKEELTFSQAQTLFIYGQITGIEVFFSVFDVERVDWCERIGVERYKVSFANRNNEELLEAIEKTGKPIFVSTSKPIDYYPSANTTYLYCIPEYPTPLEKINWDEMRNFSGFSDHTVGIECAKKALSKGVKIIEKHICLEGYKGIDHELSITPKQLKELVSADEARCNAYV